MTRSRPEQHLRTLSSGKTITVNRGVDKRKVYKPSNVKKQQREFGNKITYKPVGFHQVAIDELGTLRGSRIIKNPAAMDTSSTYPEIIKAELKQLDNKLASREISIDDYNDELENLLIN